MLEAADYCAVVTYPMAPPTPPPLCFLLVPRVADGRNVIANWDTLGMRATRSDSLVLEECWVPESAAVFQTDDFGDFRADFANWFWASYTPVYLGVGFAAYIELLNVLNERQPRATHSHWPIIPMCAARSRR